MDLAFGKAEHSSPKQASPMGLAVVSTGERRDVSEGRGELGLRFPQLRAKTGLLPGICPQKPGAKQRECLSESGNWGGRREPGK